MNPAFLYGRSSLYRRVDIRWKHHANCLKNHYASVKRSLFFISFFLFYLYLLRETSLDQIVDFQWQNLHVSASGANETCLLHAEDWTTPSSKTPWLHLPDFIHISNSWFRHHELGTARSNAEKTARPISLLPSPGSRQQRSPEEEKSERGKKTRGPNARNKHSTWLNLTSRFFPIHFPSQRRKHWKNFRKKKRDVVMARKSELSAFHSSQIEESELTC